MSPYKIDRSRQTVSKKCGVYDAARQPSIRGRLSASAILRRVRYGPEQALDPDGVRELQQTAGNQAVEQLLAERLLSPQVNTLITQARGAGSPLPYPNLYLSPLREGVRIHTDARADRLAKALRATAFTSGRDIFFRHGQFDPHSSRGRKILKHELAHVIQQGGRHSAYQLKLGAVHDLSEQQAERAAGSGAPVHVQPGVSASVQRLGWPFGKKKENKTNEDVVSAKATKQTTFNPVTRMIYKTGIAGSKQKSGFFKPNNPAETTDTSTMAARSVASYQFAKAAGLGDYISPEAFAEHGDEGGVSAMVPGRAMFDKDDATGKTKMNLHDFTNPETQKSMSTIQLMDAITGQVDRHGGNIRIDPKSGRARAYDNDKAFSQGTVEFWGNKKVSGTEDQAEKMKRMNAPFDKYHGLPSLIDESAANKILKMKAKNLPKILNQEGSSQRLTDEEVAETQTRLRAVKAHLKDLKKNKQLVKKWDMRTYMQQVNAPQKKDAVGRNFADSYLQRSVDEFKAASTNQYPGHASEVIGGGYTDDPLPSAESPEEMIRRGRNPLYEGR